MPSYNIPPPPSTSHSARRSGSGSRHRDGARHRRDVRHHPFAGEKDPNHPTKGEQFRSHLVAMFSEFIGTVMFLWFAFAGTQAAARIEPTMSTAHLMYIALSFGFSLMVTVWAHYRISGGLFNPAVTLALCLTKNLPIMRGILLLPAQVLGGIVAAALVKCMFPGEVATVTTLSPDTSIAQGVFIEAFGTALLVFVILMLAAEKHEATPFAPVGIGIALFVIELATVLYTGGSVNPARSFGPSVVAPTFPEYHYIYWFGPLIGSLMASVYYGFNRATRYWEVNPGQDAKRG